MNAVGIKLSSSSELSSAAMWGPMLHRWGSAFPGNIPTGGADNACDARVCSEARLAFAGDFLAEPGGSIERACLSGFSASRALIEAASK